MLFSKLKEHILQNNITNLLISAVITSIIIKFSESIADNIVIPLMKLDINDNEKSDMKELEEYLSKKNININIRNILNCCVKLLLMLGTLYFVLEFLLKSSN